MVVRLLKPRRAQNTVEYMLYISVIVVSLCVMAYIFLGNFSAGYNQLASDATNVFQEGMRNGSGDQR